MNGRSDKEVNVRSESTGTKESPAFQERSTRRNVRVKRAAHKGQTRRRGEVDGGLHVSGRAERGCSPPLIQSASCGLAQFPQEEFK